MTNLLNYLNNFQKNQNETVNQYLYRIVTDIGGRIEVSDDLNLLTSIIIESIIIENKSFTIFLSPITSPLHDNYVIAFNIGLFLLNQDKNIKILNRVLDNNIKKELQQFVFDFLCPTIKSDIEQNVDPLKIAIKYDLPEKIIIQYINQINQSFNEKLVK